MMVKLVAMRLIRKDYHYVLVNAQTVQVPITDSISPVRHAIDLDLRRVCGFD